MNVSDAKKKIKDPRIQEIIWRIDHKQVKDDDEWLQVAKELGVYAESDIPEDVKRLFYPLGYLEMLTIIVDGITRWRSSICVRCRKQKGCPKSSCSVHPDGIPTEIWADENADCPDFQKNE